MARSAAQSDFSVARPTVVALPATADAVALPDAETLRTQAGELSSRWVMRATWLVQLAQPVHCHVRPQKPARE
jgi:hypothetical protein